MKVIRSALLLFAASLAAASCGERAGAPMSPASVAAADANADSPIDRPFRLKSADELDVDRLFRLLPLYLRPTYEKATFDPRSGATIVTGLKFGSEKTADGFAAGRAEFYGVDLDRIERLNGETDAPLDAPFSPVLAKLRLFDVETFAGEEGRPKTSIKAVEIDSLRVRGGGIPKTSGANGLAALINAFDFAGVYFKDIRTTGGDVAESDTGAAFDFAAADLRFVGAGGGKLKAVIGRDLEYEVRQSADAVAAASRKLGPMAEILVSGPLRAFIAPEEQRTKIKTLEWRNISFAGLLDFGLRGEQPPITARNLMDLGTAKLTDVETYVGEKRFSLTPEVDIPALEFAWLAPSKVRAVTRGGVYDFTALVPDKEREAISLLKTRRLDRVRGDSDFAYDWNPDRGGAVLSAGYDSAGFADFDLDLALEGLELKGLEAARAGGAANPAAETARLGRFSLIISDETMLDAFFELSALETGGTAKDVRSAAPAVMRLTRLELQRKNPRTAGFIDAVAAFLEDGGTLEIRAEPETPAPLSVIGDNAARGPDAVAAAINLTVTQRD